MSNIICSLCRGDHTYEEHMQTERDMLDMSVDRHPAGKHPSQTRHLLSWDNGKGTSEVDHAWATIPRDQPGVAPTPHTPLLALAVARVRPLVTFPNIAAAVCYSGFVLMFAAIICAWFFDWKMP